MGLFDRFKKSEKKEVKKKPETLGEVIIQEVERYNKMTPEEQLEHRRMLRNRWLKKSGNRQRVREWNKRYLRSRWLKMKNY